MPFFFDHAIRERERNIAGEAWVLVEKCMVQGRVHEKLRRGITKLSYICNLAKWTGGSMAEITRDSHHCARWRKLVRGTARTADRHSYWERRRMDRHHVIPCMSDVELWYVIPLEKSLPCFTEPGEGEAASMKIGRLRVDRVTPAPLMTCSSTK